MENQEVNTTPNNDEKPMENNNNVEVEYKIHSIPILKIIKVAQSQHGMRHASYNNYRNYCSRKIRRVKHALNFKNHKMEKKKEKYIKREMTANHYKVKQEYLMIPLFSAERAWAHAMEMKENNSNNKRVKHHIRRKMSKASAQSKLLFKFIQDSSDDKTQLEAQSYSLWMQGVYALEMKQWKESLTLLSSSQKLFEQLKNIGDKEFQQICEERLSNIEPSIRFCNYHLNNTSKTENSQVNPSESQVSESQIKSVLEQKKLGETLLKEILYKGKPISIKSEDLKTKMLQIQQIKSQIQNENSLVNKIKLSDGLFAAYDEANQAVNQYFSKQSTTKKQKEGKTSQKKIFLGSYLSENQILDTMERNLFLIKLAEKRIQAIQDEDTNSEEITNLLGSHSKHSDISKLYSNILYNIEQFKSLLDQNDVEQNKIYTSKALSYKAFQHFWLALSFSHQKEFSNALALFNFTQQLIVSAIQHHQNCTNPSAEDIKSLNLLTQQIRSEKSILRANNFIHQQSSQSISTNTTPTTNPNLPLLQRLYSFSSQKEEIFLTSIPPSPSPIPTKPVSFDLALVKCQFPSLDERKKKKKTGFWGWW